MTTEQGGSTTDTIEYRPHRLFAVIEGRHHVDAAIDDLAEAGIDQSEIDTFTGPEDARRLDPSPQYSGPLGGLRRVMVADETRVAQIFQRAARDGRYIVRVCERDRRHRRHAASILARHEASAIVDFGRFGYEPIDPAATEPPPEVSQPDL